MNNLQNKPMISDRIVMKHIPQYHMLSDEQKLQALQNIGKSGVESLKVDIFNHLMDSSYTTVNQCLNRLSELDSIYSDNYWKNVLHIIGFGNNNIWMDIFSKINPNTIIDKSIHDMDVESFWNHQEDCKYYFGDYINYEYVPYFDEFEGMMIVRDQIYTFNIQTEDQYLYDYISDFSRNYLDQFLFFKEISKKKTRRNLNKELGRYNNSINNQYFNEKNHGFLFIINNNNHIDIVIDNFKMAKMITLNDFYNFCENHRTITDQITNKIDRAKNMMIEVINNSMKEND